ncbi:MAG: hypothetical protein R2765_06760 [Ferruginibacter sp.]
MTVNYKYILALLVACFSSLFAMAQEEETKDYKIDMKYLQVQIKEKYW